MSTISTSLHPIAKHGIKSKSMTKQEQSTKAALREFESQTVPLMDGLYANARKLCGYQHASYVEDLVAETYAKAFRSWNTFEQGTSLNAWMKTIMKNTFYNFSDKARRDSKFSSLDAIEEWQQEANHSESLTATTTRSAEAEAIDNLSGSVVSEALAKVSPQYREVLQLVLVEDYSYAETAEKLGIPQNTVGTRLGRGKDQLREILKDYATQEGYNTKVIKKQRKNKSGIES